MYVHLRNVIEIYAKTILLGQKSNNFYEWILNEVLSNAMHFLKKGLSLKYQFSWFDSKPSSKSSLSW